MKSIKKDTIFVSIASYRDSVCNTTLKSLYENADKPKNVFVGICQQNKEEEDEDCVVSFEKNPNVKIMRIPHTDAKGPTYARYLCSTLWDNEEYYFQIDSHTSFVKHWDTKLINMIKEIKELGLSDKPVLSHYPKEIGEYKDYKDDDNDKYQVPRMCKSFFNNRDMISFLGAEIIDTKKQYYKTPYVAGGMCFSESSFLNELPYDPELPYLFVGEEILHTIRFYTNGWDVFTPNENIIFHEYTRKDKPKIWTDNPYYSDMPAFEKVKYYIGFSKDDSKIKDELKKNVHKYGLGKKRSLDDFYKYIGADLEKKIIKSNFCRKDNKANEDDILNSNEKNHKKTKENFEILGKNKGIIEKIIIGFIVLIILILIYFCFFHKKNVKQISSSRNNYSRRIKLI